MKPILPTLICLGLTAAYASAQTSFYAQPQLFSYCPDETKSLRTVKHFGAVGMGIDLIQPAFQMQINLIEEGSPAAATGKLKPGQMIQSINGQVLKDIDPRIQLGQIIEKAEATDGIVKFVIEGEAEPVIVKIPVLGAYGPTWPLNCKKSDKIVRDLAEYLKKPGSDKGFADIGMLFLLSTGDEKDLETVKNWAREVKPKGITWTYGYGGIALCEYYLRTGDKEAFDNVQAWADVIVATQYLDAWAPRSGPPGILYGNGHLNASSTHMLTVLLLAKECGAEIPDRALLSALRHFYRLAGHGNNPYGDSVPEDGFVDNGKNGLLAFAMAAAASLTPDGENSLYAKARDVMAMTAFYNTPFMLHGHTGGGIGEIWRSSAMGLLDDVRPHHYREFMDQRKWHYDMSRRFDGSSAILDGEGYDQVKFGTPYFLTYTVPRKTLRITGAPPSKFSKPYQLPKLIWGTEADAEFLSLDPVTDPSGQTPDHSKDTLAADASMALFRQLPKWTEKEIRYYLHHQDHNVRYIAAGRLMELPNKEKLSGELLQHPSARIRRAIFTEYANIKKLLPVSREVFDLAIKSLADPKESLWVREAALGTIARGKTEWLIPQVDLILSYLKNDDSWIQRGALFALTPLIAEPATYQKVLPAVGEILRTNQRSSLTVGLMPAMRANISAASPAVQQLAVATLKESYLGYAGVDTAPGGLNIASVKAGHLTALAASLKDIPGGVDVLYQISREKFPDQTLPYRDLILGADPDSMGAELKKLLPPLVMDELVPEYVGKNWTKLQTAIANKTQTGTAGAPGDAIQDLVALYTRAGHPEYNWKMFSDLRNAEWNYHSFDPIAAEQVPFDQIITRYRKVTLPKGMENWFATDFDPAKAGWKQGKSPFGQFAGKIPDKPIMKCAADTCIGPNCWGATPINTLWEKEVLLLHGIFKVPALEPGHRYRIRVNDGDHVGSGGGHIIYINGKPLVEMDACYGRGAGGRPKGSFITADFLNDFQGKEVHIALKTFLRYNDKYHQMPNKNITQGKISIHLEQQQLPPMGDDLRRKSAAVIPMLSSQWQALFDPESNELGEGEGMFRWDGKFTPNPAITGSWKLVGQVPEISDFDPAKKSPAIKPVLSSITFNNDGSTKDPAWLWSGDMLMDLTRNQVLKMVTKEIDGKNHLFIESGGFGPKNPPGWKSTFLVFQP